MELFKIEKHTRTDKRFKITGPDDFKLLVDYDDVDHKEVDKQTKKMVDILNKHWDGDFSMPLGAAMPFISEEDEEFEKWFKDSFDELTEEHRNSEELENFKMEKTGSITKITFDVDCGRAGVHRENYVTIDNKKKAVQIRLSEIIEFCGIEDGLKTALLKKLKWKE